MKVPVITACWFLVCVTICSAWAHGPAPTGLGIAAFDTDGSARVIRISRGLAIQEDAHWRFVCPSAWQGPETPLVGAHDGVTMPWIVGSQSLVSLQPDGTSLSIETEPSITAAVARAMVHTEETTLILTGFSSPSIVWRLEGGQASVLWESEIVWATMVFHEDRVYLGREHNGGLELVRFFPNNIQVETMDISSEQFGSPDLRSAGGRLFLRTFANDQFSLAEVSIEETKTIPILTSPKPIHGPVGGHGDYPLVLATDHRLHLLTSMGVQQTEETKHITCLHEYTNGTMVACLYPDLYTVTEDGMIGVAVFQLDRLTPPNVNGLSSEEQQTCHLEWVDLATDAGLNITTDPTPTQSDSSGCTAQSLPGASHWFLFAVVVFLMRVQRSSHFREWFPRP